MPSPVGHALGGLAAGWLVQKPAAAPAARRWASIGFAALAVAPDLDLVFGTHRGAAHSLVAAALAGLTVWLVLRPRVAAAGRLAAACAAAYGSHVLLDWLGSDTSAPFGVVALWPFSAAYFIAPWHVFLPISRRIGQPELFWMPNVLALLREAIVLVPIVALVYRARRQRTSTPEEALGNRPRMRVLREERSGDIT